MVSGDKADGGGLRHQVLIDGGSDPSRPCQPRKHDIGDNTVCGVAGAPEPRQRLAPISTAGDVPPSPTHHPFRHESDGLFVIDQ